MVPGYTGTWEGRAAHCLHLPTLGVYTVNVISEKEENLLVPLKRQS